MPETLVVERRATHRIPAHRVDLPAAAPLASINHGQRPASARRRPRAAAAAGPAPPTAVEVSWAPDGAGGLVGTAVALDAEALQRRVRGPRPPAGERRVVQRWVPPRGGLDHHLAASWRETGDAFACARRAAPEVRVRRAVPERPEPVDTPWLVDALRRATAAAVDALERAAGARPAGLDLVFKLGASNELHLLWCEACDFAAPEPPQERVPEPAPAPVLPRVDAAAPRPVAAAAAFVARARAPAPAAPRPPPSAAQGPRRRPFKKRGERLVKRKAAPSAGNVLLLWRGREVLPYGTI